MHLRGIFYENHFGLYHQLVGKYDAMYRLQFEGSEAQKTIPKLVGVEPIDSLQLKLFYETGECRLFDVAPYVRGSWFGHLGDIAYFHTVRLLPDGAGIAWPEGQDIAPHELYECSSLLST